MTSGGATGNESPDTEDNPLRTLADIISMRASQLNRPRPETDRRTNYRQPPAPPGVDLTTTGLEDTVRRDPNVIDHVYEVARTTTTDHATERRSIRIEASTGREILDYLDANRGRLPAQLRERIDTTADRLLRRAYAASTRTRLVCPFCGGQTVVPTPDLKTLVCLDYACAPKHPRRVDPTLTQEPERRITAKQLALLAGSEEGAIRKKLWRAKVQPVHTGPHGKHEYRWADVAHLVAPKPTPPTTPPAATANRESRSGGIVQPRAA